MGVSAEELGIILLSLKVALVSVAFSLPVAIGVAYFLARFDFPGKILLDAIVHLPLVLPPVVVGFALLVLVGRLSFAAIDRRLETVARTLGGSRAWVFVSVTLPLARPGIVTGVVLSFARSLGEFGATITFVANIPGETQTLPLAIYAYTQTPSGDPQALRLSIIAVILSIVALVVAEWIARRKTAFARRQPS
jgi:molybdate transport system permease protein